MADPKFRGVIPPVVVPLDANRQLDVEAFERSINRMIEGGVNGLFFLGSSGEVAFLNDEQRYQVLAEAVRIVDHRVPVLAGVIDMETNRVIKQIERTRDFDIDGLVATAPFYALGGPKENERHFRVLREHTNDIPLFAYDLPVCVHTKLDPTMLVRLGKDGVLAGVKDSSGDDVSFRWLMLENEDAGHPLALLTGHEVVVDGAYLGGADGSVPGLANLAPKEYVQMWTPTRRAIGTPCAKGKTIWLASCSSRVACRPRWASVPAWAHSRRPCGRWAFSTPTRCASPSSRSWVKMWKRS